MSTENEKEKTAAQAEEEKEAAVPEQSEEIKQEAPSGEDKKNEKTEKPSKKDKKAEKKEKAEKSEKEKEELHAQELAEKDDKYLRLAAEYDNFRRRSQKEKDNLYSDIKADVLAKFLPVYDNLERALKASTEDEAYRKGVEMIMTQFNATIEKLNVEKIDSLGKTFDPAVHNAVMHVEDETKGENEVVEVFQEGFKIGDKVIRCAMVKVAN